MLVFIGAQSDTAELFNTDSIETVYDDRLQPVVDDYQCPGVDEALRRWKRDGFLPDHARVTNLEIFDGFLIYHVDTGPVDDGGESGEHVQQVTPVTFNPFGRYTG